MVDGLVSIITPCYNGERFIAETIESVLGQTYANWEMIVVDDGSRDNTAQVAAGYAARDGRIQVVRQPNGGTASARNNAMRRAKGRYIALLDGIAARRDQKALLTELLKLHTGGFGHGSDAI